MLICTRMQLGEALCRRSANPISAGAAARREAVNRWSEVLSHSELFGVEFTNINKRKGTSALKGWVGGLWDESSPGNAPNATTWSCFCCWGSSAPLRAGSARQKFCLSCGFGFFLPPLMCRRDWKKNQLVLLIVNHSEHKPGLAELTVQSERWGNEGEEEFSWFLDALMSLIWGFPYYRITKC